MPFLSLIEPIFAWNIPLVSLIYLKRSLIFPILLFSSSDFLYQRLHILCPQRPGRWHKCLRADKYSKLVVGEAKLHVGVGDGGEDTALHSRIAAWVLRMLFTGDRCLQTRPCENQRRETGAPKCALKIKLGWRKGGRIIERKENRKLVMIWKSMKCIHIWMNSYMNSYKSYS